MFLRDCFVFFHQSVRCSHKAGAQERHKETKFIILSGPRDTVTHAMKGACGRSARGVGSTKQVESRERERESMHPGNKIWVECTSKRQKGISLVHLNVTQLGQINSLGMLNPSSPQPFISVKPALHRNSKRM